MKRTLTIAVLITTLFTGCSNNSVPSWLLGKWQYDSKITDEAFQKTTKEKPELMDVAFAMIKAFLPSIEWDISQKNIILFSNGRKEVTDISVFEKKGNTCTIRQADGKLIEYHKANSGIWFTTDDGKFKIYLKHKDT